MGFKENLKAELAFQGLMVKELADRTKINKSTLDNYLRDKHSNPTAENAVKIARALGVSVEYLVTGSDTAGARRASLEKDLHSILSGVEGLSSDERKVVIDLIGSMKSHLR